MDIAHLDTVRGDTAAFIVRGGIIIFIVRGVTLLMATMVDIMEVIMIAVQVIRAVYRRMQKMQQDIHLARMVLEMADVHQTITMINL